MTPEQFQSDLSVRPELCGSPLLLAPFAANISSPRLAMLASHATQIVIVNGCELPRIQSGFESKYGKYEYDLSSRDQDIRIVSVIPKFRTNTCGSHMTSPPTLTVIYVGNDDGKVGYINVNSYTALPSGFGYINKRLNTHQLTKGNFIAKETKFITAPNHDGEHYMLGVNAKVVYIPLWDATEDAFPISRRLQKKYEHQVVTTVSFDIASDAIPLNLYGTDEDYKVIPDIGEPVRDDGLLLGFRTLNQNSFLSDTTAEALAVPEFLHDDLHYVPRGATIVDIEIYTNQKVYGKFNELDGAYAQLMRYQTQYHDYYATIIDEYEKLKKEGYKMNSSMINLITRFRALCYHRGGKAMMLMNKKEPVEFIHLKVTYAYNRQINKGFKITGRDGAPTITLKFIS